METVNGIRRMHLPEENIMAILDLIGVKEQDDIQDDKLSFLAAIRTICIIPQTVQVPTRKMYEAVFQILRDSRSLELAVVSYQLLQDLEKCFPRVTVAEAEGSLPNDGEIRLVVNPEVWSPFIFENDSSEIERNSTLDLDHFDCSKLYSLTQDIAHQVCHGDSTCVGESESQGRSKKSIPSIMTKMMMFQYLVTLLKRDFLCRCQVFKKNEEWSLIRNALLNQLLGSQRATLRNLVRNILYIMAATTTEDFGISHGIEHNSDSIRSKLSQKHDLAVHLAEAEFRHTLCQSVETLLTLTMELDKAKKEANQKGWTSRSDGYRTPVLEIVIDELSYNKELICPFLQAMTEAKWKTNIIMSYFLKHCPRSVAKMFESNIEETTIKDILSCFSNLSNARSIPKRIGEDVIQLLLVHGFQAYFPLQQGAYRLSHVKSNAEDESFLKEICASFITTFRNLKSVYKKLELVAGGKEALFTASTIMS